VEMSNQPVELELFWTSPWFTKPLGSYRLC
jgi:hypothetical protein